MKEPRFYLTQFGAIWRVTRVALVRILEDGARFDGAYSISGDGVTQLAERFSESSFDRREGFLPRKWRRKSRIALHREMLRLAHIDASNQR